MKKETKSARARTRGAAWLFLAAALWAGPLWGESPGRVQIQVEENGSDSQAALDAELENLESDEPKPKAKSQARLIDISADIIVALGASNVDGEELESLQTGGHDPKVEGFNVPAVELSIGGLVDQNWSAQGYFVTFLDPEGETQFEIEEVFAQTTLGNGVQLELGTFLTEFGRLNPQHVHTWAAQDQPIIHGRVLGPDGARGPGVRVGFQLPFSWYSQLHVGAQMSDATGMPSFLGEAHDHGHEEEEEEEELFEHGVGGRPRTERGFDDLGDSTFLARWENGFDLSDETSALWGASALWGPNASGPSGDTTIYGADVVVKWRPEDNFRGWPFVRFEAEWMRRDYEADPFTELDVFGTPGPVDDVVLPAATLEDEGWYAQLLWGFSPSWIVGVRVEEAGSSGDNVHLEVDEGLGTIDVEFEDPIDDPSRNERTRISPMVIYQPTEFSRVRFQVNFDDAQHLTDDAVTWWLGFEWLLGAHPPHSY